MCIIKRNSNGNNNPDWHGFNRKIFLVIGFEFAIECGRIRLEKNRRKTLESERQIAILFKDAYKLVKANASIKEIANVLNQIKEIGQRAGFIEDHKRGEKKDDPG